MPNFIEDLNVIYHLLKPIKGNTHQERLENFYQGQATAYDNFRRRLLQGREYLYNTIVDLVPQGTWVDMGGGTGANFEFIGDRLGPEYNIYVVDLSVSLLEIAKQRVESRGWSFVKTVEYDVTQFVPPEGQADIVTFSYSLTMIPNWFAAIEQAYKILKPNGIIGIVDFYVSRKYPLPGQRVHPWWVRAFWQSWFYKDNVFLSQDHIPFLEYKFESVSLSENMALVPFTLGAKVPYYIYIGRKAH